jgi:sarcosine oxidase subunit gamma
MSNLKTVNRISSLEGRLAGGAGVSISVVAPKSRISLRVKEGDVAKIGKAIGVTLPTSQKSSVQSPKDDRAALWIGPDEWLVLGAENVDFMGALSKVKAVHSAADISHRNIAILVEGVKSLDVLMAGCPQNLSDDAFPIGACSRTVYGKSEVVIWRTDENTYHVECWRSFSDYVFKYMEQAAKGL